MRRRLVLIVILLFAISAQVTRGQEPKPSPTATPAVQETKTFTGIPPGFQTTENPTAGPIPFWIPRRNPPATEVDNKVANVTALQIEKVVVYSPCTSEAKITCAGDEAKIRITTEAEDKENDVLTYAYTVNAGKIIGQGTNVTWDLSGVPPGNYTITAGVNDGCGVCGATMTKHIEVKVAPEVESITLDKRELSTLCPSRRANDTQSECAPLQMNVGVKTVVKNADNLTYYYSVSGGKVVGEGSNIKWEFGDAPPGEYTITVGVGRDNVIFGKPLTKTVLRKECQECCMIPCDCGILSAEGPESAKSGDTIIVTASVVGGPEVTFKWMIPAGAILNDPTGSSIMVKIPADFKEPVFTATVELSGTAPHCSCPTTTTVVVKIDK